MKTKLTHELTLYFIKYFPINFKKNTTFKHTVTIGIGGNIGNSIKLFQKLFIQLKRDRRFVLLNTSPILQNPPFGFTEQNDFFNAIIILKTNYSPKEILKIFQSYEKKFKRKRTFQDAPRTLDIDIIFFDNKKVKKKDLTIPHIGYKNRQSVLIPLKYITKKSNLTFFR